jgi:hypothetical protein
MRTSWHIRAKAFEVLKCRPADVSTDSKNIAYFLCQLVPRSKAFGL